MSHKAKMLATHTITTYWL